MSAARWWVCAGRRVRLSQEGWVVMGSLTGVREGGGTCVRVHEHKGGGTFLLGKGGWWYVRACVYIRAEGLFSWAKVRSSVCTCVLLYVF